MKKMVYAMVIVAMVCVTIGCSKNQTTSSSRNEPLRLNDLAPSRPYMKIEFDAKELVEWQVYGTCFNPINPMDSFPQMGNGGGPLDKKIITGPINPDALSKGMCHFAVNFMPAVKNSCGFVNWIPCRNSKGRKFGFESGSKISVSYSSTGREADLIKLPIAIQDNGQGGANFRVNLKSLQ